MGQSRILLAQVETTVLTTHYDTHSPYQLVSSLGPPEPQTKLHSGPNASLVVISSTSVARRGMRGASL